MYRYTSGCEAEGRGDTYLEFNILLSLTIKTAKMTKIFSNDAALSQWIIDTVDGQCPDILVTLSSIAQSSVSIAERVNWFEELTVT